MIGRRQNRDNLLFDGRDLHVFKSSFRPGGAPFVWLPQGAKSAPIQDWFKQQIASEYTGFVSQPHPDWRGEAIAFCRTEARGCGRNEHCQTDAGKGYFRTQNRSDTDQPFHTPNDPEHGRDAG